MRRRYVYLFTCLLVMASQASGQKMDFNNYQPLGCAGKIPQDFLTSFSEKYKSGKNSISEMDRRKVQKSKDRFLRASNFYLNELLLSGKVVFGDPVTVFVNKVADKLLASQPELRSQLRFYTTKSQYVNAFSTDQGIIFVNVGLIAQLENEAQLAYILAHEIVHFAEKHNMDLYVATDKKGQKKGVTRSRYELKMLNRSYRSKESEFEADREGLLTYYAKSDYSLQSVRSAFDVMLFSYLPFDEVKFQKSFFETSCLKFPGYFLLDSVSDINASAYYSEESETHPSIEKRSQSVFELLDKQKEAGKSEFLVGREEFLHIRNVCRFEALRMKMIDGDFINALYDCYLMQRDFPDNRYLNVTTAACLYGLSRYKSEWKTLVTRSYKKIQGEQQQIYYFLQKLSRKELSVLALNYCWHVRLKYPGDNYLEQICEDLMIDVAMVNKVPLKFFSRENPYDAIPKKQESDSLSKYGKIRQKQLKEGGEEDFLRFAFVDLLKDPVFLKRYQHYDSLRETEDEENTEKELSRREYKKYLKEKNKPCTTQCVDQLVLTNPLYLQYYAGKNERVQFFSTAMLRQDFISRLEENAKKANMGTTLLLPDKLTEDETERWNEIAFANDWFEERMTHDEIELIPFESENMQKFMEKHNASHLMWNGIISVRIPFVDFNTMYLCCLPFTFPIDIYRIFKPYYQIYLFQVVFNTQSGKCLDYNVQRPNSRYWPSSLNRRLYKSFIKIKRMKRDPD